MTMPSWLSRDYITGGIGVAGGLIFSDYAAASLISRTGLTGGAAIAGSALTKGILGAILFYAAAKVGAAGGLIRPLLGLASIGCFSSIIIDGIRYVFPATESAAARLRAAFGRRVAAAPVAGVRLAGLARQPPAGVPAGVRLRAGTPSGAALGGF